MKNRILLLLILLSAYLFQCTTTGTNINASLDKYVKKFNHKLATIDFDQSEEKLFKIGLDFLNNKYDILSAERVFKYLVTKKPNNVKYLYYEGRAAFFVGEYNYFPNVREPYDIAYNYLEKLVEIDPKNKDYLLMKSYARGRIAGFVKKEEGLFSALGDFIEAKNLLENILAIDPNHANAILTLAETEFDGGNPFADETKGLNMYNKVLRNNPDNMRVHVLFGNYYRNKGKNAQALKEYYKAQKIYDKGKAPNIPEVDLMYAYLARNKGNVLWALGKHKQACEQYEIHRKRRPTSSSAYHWLGICYNHFGKKDKAIISLKRAVYLDKWNNGAKNMLNTLVKK